MNQQSTVAMHTHKHPKVDDEDCRVDISIECRGDVHIHNCDRCRCQGDPSGQSGGGGRDCPPGACLPVVAGAKHKQSRDQRLAAIASGAKMPSVLAAGVMHTCRRFLLGKAAANALERDAFVALESTSSEMRDVLACAVDSWDALPSGLRNRLFDSQVTTDEDQPVTVEQLTAAFTHELFGRMGDLALGDTAALEEERPGKVRIFVPNDDVFPSPVRICRLNGLRTGHFRPPLDAGDYLADEVQQVCEIQIVDSAPQVTCEVQTTDCPGNSAAGVCLRVPDVAAGDSVVLDGVNFFSTDAIVRLSSATTTVDLDAHVVGDVETPVTEVIDGAPSLVMDCRVHDRLIFTVPADLPADTYSVTVVVPNITGVDFWGDFLLSEQEFITVVPPPTARFRITSETLFAEEETSPAWAGSDEVGLKFLSAVFFPDGTTALGPDVAPVRLGNVDSGNTRDVTRPVFSHDQPIAALALMVLGHEVDSDDAYEKLITDWTDVFVDLVKKEFTAIAGALAGAGGLEALGKLPGWGWVAIAIAIVVLLAIDLIIALWAPADLIMEDSIGLSSVDLAQLCSPDFPLPQRERYTSAQGIDVLRDALDKLPTQYREERAYHSTDEESTYRLTLRFNRVA